MTKVAVIGVGHLGKQHARLYSELEDVQLTGVVDILEPRAREIAGLNKTAAFIDYPVSYTHLTLPTIYSV